MRCILKKIIHWELNLPYNCSFELHKSHKSIYYCVFITHDKLGIFFFGSDKLIGFEYWRALTGPKIFDYGTLFWIRLDDAVFSSTTTRSQQSIATVRWDNKRAARLNLDRRSSCREGDAVPPTRFCSFPSHFDGSIDLGVQLLQSLNTERYCLNSSITRFFPLFIQIRWN